MIIKIIASALLALSAVNQASAGNMLSEFHKQFRNESGPMTFSMVPGYKVSVDGQEFSVFGREHCPNAVTAKVIILGGGYDYPGMGTNACVVIEPSTETVVVRRVIGGSLVDEVWRVVRGDNETISLWTPDGKPIAAAPQN